MNERIQRADAAMAGMITPDPGPLAARDSIIDNFITL